MINNPEVACALQALLEGSSALNGCRCVACLFRYREISLQTSARYLSVAQSLLLHAERLIEQGRPEPSGQRGD